MHFRSPDRQPRDPEAPLPFGCHPDPPQDGEGPLRCNLRFLFETDPGIAVVRVPRRAPPARDDKIALPVSRFYIVIFAVFPPRQISKAHDTV